MVQVSVIMAVYNCRATVGRAIDSVLSQTFTDWELIICDDCSTDGTKKVLSEYQSRYPERITVIENDKNSKLPFSLNRCLSYASGKYIARMDGDDISLPERFERQVDYLENHPECDVVGTSMTRFDENGEYDKYEAVKNPCKETLLTQVPFCHATIMMKKSVYDALGGYIVLPRTERGQDLDLWFRFFSKGFQGSNLPESLYLVCEDRNAIRRRKLKYDIYATQTRKIGFRLLGFPKSKYYLVYLPIISRFVPRKLKLLRRRILASREN